MEFLKAIYGDKSLSYEDLVQAINAHNGDEANKENQIKIGNLGGGEYVGRGKHDSEMERLNAILGGKQNELDAANGLIAELQKSAKGNEEMLGKISAYDTQVQQLQKQLAETREKAALKVNLLREKALDIDYLTYKIYEKLREEGKALELDENENIKGWDDLRSGLKTQFPTQFESTKNGIQVEAAPLPTRENGNSGLTREQFNQMGYQSRLKLKQEQPEVYAQMTGKTNI